MSRPVTPPIHDDTALRALHAQALQQLSPATLARLRSARSAAAPRHTRAHGWWMATACSAVAALALGYSFTVNPPTTPAAPTAAPTVDDSSDVLDENPDLYVWLGTTDLAME
ncbi:hypothetical protein [Stenotrophomonas sp. BIGb0135]|uniref:hypothetical protein n=1 Tax=Stenotrophomonas sp. BIGb0135 TaxID=2940620 RepID=UPI002166E5B5|nr:hypothetical protein [Stenotrophomonas sp. BIGb0135]MCS4236321.1 hypothetical protein [Stenotrophomonas sp. BIGb0135]